MRKINVIVLMGGKSSEREVSLSTGRMIIKALDREKYNAYALDTGAFLDTAQKSCSEDTADMIYALADIFSASSSLPKVDVAFIALHGRFGEDGTVQGLLELLGIPYVGSGVLASALAMDKIVTRRILLTEGIPVPNALAVSEPFDTDALIAEAGRCLGYPMVVKPSREGSTVGISIIRSEAEIASALELALKYDSDVLIEEFVEGTEITVPVLGNRALEVLPVVEIVPESGFYDYHAKYTPGATEEIVPARIPDEAYAVAQELGMRCHQVLGCRGMSRTDMIVRFPGEEGVGESKSKSKWEILVLETNTIPGMTPTSLLPCAAKAAGIEFPELVDKLIGYALEGRPN